MNEQEKQAWMKYIKKTTPRVNFDGFLFFDIARSSFKNYQLHEIKLRTLKRSNMPPLGGALDKMADILYAYLDPRIRFQ